jgi:preprotein translocase subunit SecF
VELGNIFDFDSAFDRVYEDYDKYLAIPIVLILLAGGVMGASYLTNGEVLQKGTDFAGGTEVQFQIEGDYTVNEIETAYANAGRQGANAIRQASGNNTYLLVQIPPPLVDSEEEAASTLRDAGYNVEVIGFNSISASVSGEFFTQAMIAFAMAFTIMSLVIFIAFRDLTPSLAVIFAAAGDILIAMAGMVLLGVPLTLGSLAALLMLIGYSVDTDIVLSTRVLKRDRGSLKERILSSIKTGTTMSAGGIAGFTLLYIVSYIIVGSSELSNIAAVMVVGLLADMPLTWLGNTVILKKYVEGDFSFFGEVLPWN